MKHLQIDTLRMLQLVYVHARQPILRDISCELSTPSNPPLYYYTYASSLQYCRAPKASASILQVTNAHDQSPHSWTACRAHNPIKSTRDPTMLLQRWSVCTPNDDLLSVNCASSGTSRWNVDSSAARCRMRRNRIMGAISLDFQSCFLTPVRATEGDGHATPLARFCAEVGKRR